MVYFLGALRRCLWCLTIVGLLGWCFVCLLGLIGLMFGGFCVGVVHCGWLGLYADAL